jgi:hypothetical protein
LGAGFLRVLGAGFFALLAGLAAEDVVCSDFEGGGSLSPSAGLLALIKA